MSFAGTQSYGAGNYDAAPFDSTNKEVSRKSSKRSSPFDKFRQMEQSQELTAATERQR